MAKHVCERCGIHGTSATMYKSRATEHWYCKDIAACDRRFKRAEKGYKLALRYVAEEQVVAQAMDGLDHQLASL